MAVYYIDLDNGNDTNNGTTWALAWKTIANGATAARIAAGDTIRISKTPDPVSIGNATWTNLSKTVTLATAQTLTIDLCNTTAYTASANITATASTTRKEGSHSCSLVVAAGFTTGKMAYKTLTTLDASAYQKLSFWFRNTVAIASATVLKVCLCSDTTGDVIVDTFWIPAIPSTSRWLPLTITKDGGGNLGSSIQSIAIYANSDPGTPTLLFDDFIACTTSGLCLQSLISKNGLAQGGTEGYYGIQSINGTTILLDNDTETGAASGRGYSGTTETVATYMRTTYKTAMASSSSTAVSTLNDSGTLGNLIAYEFGYEVGTTNQNGETFLDGLNGNGYGISLTSKNYNSVNLCALYRYYNGLNFSSPVKCIINTISNLNNNALSGFFISTAYNLTINTISNLNNNGNSGLYLNVSNNIVCNIVGIQNNNLNGLNILNGSDNVINYCVLNNNTTNYNVGIPSGNNIIHNLLSSNSNIAISTGGTNYLRNALIAESTEVTFAQWSQGVLWSFDHDQTDGNHWGFFYGGTFNIQSTTVHDTEPSSWKTAITSADRKSNYKAILPVGEFAGAASANLVVTAWVKKDHATNIACRLVCYADDALGTTEQSATKADDTNWEQLSITLNSAHANPVFKVYLETWYVAGNSNSYLGAIEVS